MTTQILITQNERLLSIMRKSHPMYLQTFERIEKLKKQLKNRQHGK